MKKINFSTFLLLACLGTSSDILAKRKAVSGSEVTGTFKSADNEILIQALGKNKLKIEMNLIYAPEGSTAPNIGTANGEAVIDGDTAVYTNEGCEITFNFIKSGSLIVTTKNNMACGFGNNVSADGTYKKSSRAKPKFSM